MLTEGFAVNPETSEVYMERFKYFNNLMSMPLALLVMLVGVVGVLWGIFKTLTTSAYKSGIWSAGIGTVLTVLSLLLCAGLNNTAYYPSDVDLQSSLTLANSSSSFFTLKVMSFVSLLIPFVLAYIFYAWRALDLKKITVEEMNGDGHRY